jgi:hypothetical protein
MMMRLYRFAAPATLACVASLLSSQVAVAAEEQDLADDSAAEQGSEAPAAAPKPALATAELPPLPAAPGAAASEPSSASAAPAADAAPERTTFVSNGSPVHIDSLGITITPPAGWEVEQNTGSLSLVMREPHQDAPSYDKPKYQKNITVAAIHQASPIDERRAAELKDELTRQFGADSLVSNFQIVEHKFFNYRGANDGLLVYSSLNIGEYPMMQMHVLVSGKDKQFLLSYTDLADSFSNTKDGGFEKAWSSIVSIEVTGETPSRENEYLRYGAFGGGFLALCLLGFFVRRRANKVDYAGEADELYESTDDAGSASGSMLATLAGGWRLEHKGDAEVSGIDFTGDAVSLAPKTRKTEFVSNY